MSYEEKCEQTPPEESQGQDHSPQPHWGAEVAAGLAADAAKTLRVAKTLHDVKILESRESALQEIRKLASMELADEKGIRAVPCPRTVYPTREQLLQTLRDVTQSLKNIRDAVAEGSSTHASLTWAIDRMALDHFALRAPEVTEVKED
jgi:hypothetical protein